MKYNSSGSSRQRRSLPMLDPGYFKIDDRTTADFLVFIEKYARLVNSHQLVNPENTHSIVDSWSPFFNSDLSIFLAKLSLTNHNDFLPFYLQEEREIGYESQRLVLQEKLDRILEFVSFISDSHPHIAQKHGEDLQVTQLLDHIEQISVNGYFKEILKSASVLAFKMDAEGISQNHVKIWGANTSTEEASADKIVIKKNIENLNRSINNFFVIAQKMIYYSKSLFLDSINNNQNHTPGTSLFIAFLKLYAFVQQDLNNITTKHLDYFYKDLLQQKLKPSEPDQVHVYFTLADHADTSVVEVGALFKAGTDEEGYERLYAADDFLTINKTRITKLCAIFLAQSDEIELEDSYEFFSNIYQSEVFTSKSGGFDFSQNSMAFAPFKSKRTKSGLKTMKVSEVGFAVASPVLLLSEGKRRCELNLRFELKSMSTLLTFLERYAVSKRLNFDKAFYQLLYRAFHISLSTSSGWYKVEDYTLHTPDSITGSLKISFVLPLGAPAITCMGDTWDKAEVELYDTAWPVLKVCLTDQKSMFMYSYLKDLQISDCDIEVKVSGIKDFEVFNDLGKIDTSNPFYPFGTLPVIGSSLLIGNEELYKKKILDFSIDLAWHNLPRCKGGFKTYYQEYDPEITTDSFKVGITALSDFEFHPLAKTQVKLFSLFTDEVEHDGQLAPVTTLKGFNTRDMKFAPDYSQTTLLPFSNKAKSGYIKLELLSPEMGFGQDKYPTLFSSKIMKGLKSSRVHLPNTPYIPQLKSITLNYDAATKISFQPSAVVKANSSAKEKIYLLQPFGIQTIFENCRYVANNFLPRYFHNGYFLLGLDQVTPNEPLTIHFILEPSVGNEFEVALPIVEWFYVSNDKWIPFEKKDLVFDTTRSFTTTGIVKLFMPKSIDDQNSILPKNCFWIVAAIKGDLEFVAKIKGVYTQALKLTWQAHKEGAQWSAPIPPNTIDGFLKGRSEVSAIFQPLPSFGGRDEEQTIEFYTRIGERLQHRNRCITAWDYEHMVLEKFPFVHQVKCISSLTHPGDLKEGKVILLVFPKPRMSDEFFLPRFNYSVLQEIKCFVENHTPPFVTIRVINPVYEEVKISASVKFKDQHQQGIGVENLHRDLINFICPWYADNTKEIQFNGSINLDELEAFMASRSYISFATKISILLLHYHKKGYSISDSVATSIKNKTLNSSKPWTVLIPMKQHAITIIDTNAYLSPGEAAIENLRVGKEFVLEEKSKKNEETHKSKNTANSKGYVTIDIDLS